MTNKEIMYEVCLRANTERIIQFDPKQTTWFIDDILEDAVEKIINIYLEIKGKENGI